MSRRGVTLILCLFLLSSILAAGAQKNKIVPPSTDTAAQAKEKSKQKESGGNVLKGWVDDVAVIITPAELSAYKKLTKDEERENFIENFWLVRDPTPDTPENEFRDEYYDRIDYANDHFTSGIAGMRTDRGKMYILNGPADEVETHPSGGAYYRTEQEGGGFTNTFPFERWRYRHLDGKGDNVIYEFVDQSMSGEYKLEYDPGAKDALRNVPNAGLTSSELNGTTTKDDRLNKSDTLLGGTSAALPDNYQGNNQFDMLEKFNDAYKVAEVKYKDLLVPSATRLSTAVLPLKVQAHYVGNGTAVRTLITVQIMTRDLAFQNIDGAQTAEAEIKGVISRIDNHRVAFINHSLVVQFPTLKAKNELLDKPNLYQETQYLVPGKYRLQLTVRDKNSQNVSNTDTLLSVPRLPADTLQASSMILAYSVTDLPTRSLGTEMFALGDKKVLPNVAGVFRTDQNLNVWQEIYGLTVDQMTHKPSATFELVVTRNKQDVKKLSTDSTELVGSGLQMKYTNSMPLKDLDPGQYEVQLKVTDNLTKESFVTTPTPSKFTVTASPAK